MASVVLGSVLGSHWSEPHLVALTNGSEGSAEHPFFPQIISLAGRISNNLDL